MAVLFDSGIFSVIGINSELLIGAKLYWYEAGTSTPLATYSDQDLTTPNPNPVPANGAGRFPPIWLQSKQYKLILTTATGTPASPLVTREPIDGVTALDILEEPDGAGKVGFSHNSEYLAATVGERLSQQQFVTDDPYNATYGSADNYDAIMRAVDAIEGTGGEVIFPAAPQPWKTSQTIQLPSGCLLVGQGKSQASYGTIAVPATMIQPTGSGPAVLLPNGTAFNGGRNISFFCTGASSAAIQWGSGASQEANFNGDSIWEDILVTGFKNPGSSAFDFQAGQRARVQRSYIIDNYNSIALGSSGSLTMFSSNVAVNNQNGKTIKANGGGSGAFQFQSYDTYYESGGGQYPIDLLNAGQYTFTGRGFEAMCAGSGTIADPAIFRLGSNALLDVDVSSLDFLSTGDFSGTLSVIDAADGARYRFHAQEVAMNYGGSGRSGVTYRAWRSIGSSNLQEIDIQRAYGSGFANMNALRQALSPLGNNLYTPLHTKARIQYIDVSGGGGVYFDNVDTPNIAVPNAGNSGNVSGIAYPLTQTGIGSSSYTIDTLPINSVSSGYGIEIEIVGSRAPSGAPGNMSAALNIICGTTTTVPISATVNTNASFKAIVRLQFIGRIQQTLEVEYKDGTGSSFTSQNLAIDNALNTLAFSVTATCAAASDVVTIRDIRLSRNK